MRIVAISSDINNNISKIRLLTPLDQLCKKENWELRKRSFYQFTRRDLTWGDIFILQRGCNKEALNIANLITEDKKFLIYEIDDLLTDMPKFLLGHADSKENSFYINKILTKCNIVSTTNHILGQKLVGSDGNYAIASNYAYPFHTQKSKTDPNHLPLATLVIAASDSIRLDFLLPSIKYILEKYQDTIKIVAIGAISNTLISYGIQAESHGILEQDDFMRLIGSMINPIGILPLDDSEFSSCKSAIKYFDYTVAAIPTIASNCSPYKDVVQNNKTGILTENSLEGWTQALEKLIQSFEMRFSIIQSATEQIENQHSLNITIEQWRAILINAKLEPKQKNFAQQRIRNFLSGIDEIIVFTKEFNRKRLRSRSEKRQSGST
jgi:O-antigen biosynthesis protein